MQNLVTLPDANELPDGKTLGIGTQRLTLAEQDCHFRMHDDHPSVGLQESEVHMLRSQYDVVRAEWLELLFRDKASQPC